MRRGEDVSDKDRFEEEFENWNTLELLLEEAEPVKDSIWETGSLGVLIDHP